MRISVWTTAYAVSLWTSASAFKGLNAINRFRLTRFPLIEDDVKSTAQHKAPMEIKVSQTYLPNASRKTNLSAWKKHILTVIFAFGLVSTLESSRDEVKVPNHFINYGRYCGPGSPDAFGEIPPVDDLDRVCQRHDQKYKMCLVNHGLPKLTSQAMAIRSFFPDNIANLYPKDFQSCIHNADAYFVRSLSELKRGHALPRWWDRPNLAPVGSEGARGFSKACAIGLNFGNSGLCLVTSEKMFYEVALNVFEADLESDFRH